jgi:hypothetical protein
MTSLAEIPAFWHNCPGPEAREGLPGYSLPRYPLAVRRELNPAARWMAQDSCGVELRFHTEAPAVRVTVGAHGGPGEVLVWRGDFFHQRQSLPADTPVMLTLDAGDRLPRLPPGTPLRRRFPVGLWRIEFGRGCGVFYGLDAGGLSVRPPAPDEVPARRWLAYGSSITHATPSGYVQQAARRLGVDALNKGLSGSCHAELAAADHFLTGERWDFLSAELGVNMRGEFPPEAFAERAGAFLDRLRRGRPDARLSVLTHFTNAQHYPHDPAAEMVRRQEAFDAFLRQWVGAQPPSLVRLIEGRDLLDDLTLLTTDLLHPAEAGQARMGENLARLLSSS